MKRAKDSERLPKPGDLIAEKYRVQRLIGRGGMGAVFAANHELLERLVALKIRHSAVHDPKATARFINEARAAAKIKGEHVARVLDVGTLEGGDPFIVMELLDGSDLAQVIARRGRLAPEEAIEHVLAAIEALAEAHALGIVHRDLKPANLFLARGAGGRHILKVLDFGISKTDGVTSPGVRDLTSNSALLGTPSYMSPEQIRAPKTVDARSDIWALGVILFELISGRRPFEADSLGEFLACVLEGRRAQLGTLVPSLHPAIEPAVDRCLAVSRDARFADVGELAEALGAALPDAGPAIGRIRASLAAREPTAARVELPAAERVARGADTRTAESVALEQRTARFEAGSKDDKPPAPYGETNSSWERVDAGNARSRRRARRVISIVAFVAASSTITVAAFKYAFAARAASGLAAAASSAVPLTSNVSHTSSSAEELSTAIGAKVPSDAGAPAASVAAASVPKASPRPHSPRADRRPGEPRGGATPSSEPTAEAVPSAAAAPSAVPASDDPPIDLLLRR